MKNLTHLTDSQLLKDTQQLAAEERRLTTEVIHHLYEVNRRRLFASRGFQSLFEYTTRELGYSDASALRRIAAMRVICECPEVEEKIRSGRLTLSNLAQAQKHFQMEKKLQNGLSLEQKREVLKSLEGKSARQAEKVLLSFSSEPLVFSHPDKVKALSETHSEIRFVADEPLLKLLNQVKGLLAHRNPNPTMAELVAEMAKLCLEKLRPKAPLISPEKNSDVGVSEMRPEVRPEVRLEKKKGKEKPKGEPDGPGITTGRYIPAEVKRTVFHRDGGKCTYVDALSGRRCDSQFALEYDHLLPHALGGEATIENLALRCRQHNLARAVQNFGLKKMSQFWS
jgi:hypothetical protein